MGRKHKVLEVVRGVLALCLALVALGGVQYVVEGLFTLSDTEPKTKGYTAAPSTLTPAVIAAEGAGTSGKPAPNGAAQPESLDIHALLAAANPENGQVLAKKCIACHSLGKGEPTKVGPNLWDIVMRPRGKAPGFAYSEAMQAKGGHWDYASLFAFIAKPQAYIPGTKMAFPGIADPKQRADLIAYLRTLSDGPPALP
jgi:cytochrome c